MERKRERKRIHTYRLHTCGNAFWRYHAVRANIYSHELHFLTFDLPPIPSRFVESSLANYLWASWNSERERSALDIPVVYSDAACFHSWNFYQLLLLAVYGVASWIILSQRLSVLQIIITLAISQSRKFKKILCEFVQNFLLMFYLYSI